MGLLPCFGQDSSKFVNDVDDDGSDDINRAVDFMKGISASDKPNVLVFLKKHGFDNKYALIAAYMHTKKLLIDTIEESNEISLGSKGALLRFLFSRVDAPRVSVGMSYEIMMMALDGYRSITCPCGNDQMTQQKFRRSYFGPQSDEKSEK